MIVVAAITVMFLPLTAVASVVGSQMFTSSRSEDGNWTVEKSPLFSDMWYITVPLTAAVVVAAWSLGWHRPRLFGLAWAVRVTAQTALRRLHHEIKAYFGRGRPISRAGSHV